MFFRFLPFPLLPSILLSFPSIIFVVSPCFTLHKRFFLFLHYFCLSSQNSHVLSFHSVFAAFHSPIVPFHYFRVFSFLSVILTFLSILLPFLFNLPNSLCSFFPFHSPFIALHCLPDISFPSLILTFFPIPPPSLSILPNSACSSFRSLTFCSLIRRSYYSSQRLRE